MVDDELAHGSISLQRYHVELEGVRVSCQIKSIAKAKEVVDEESSSCLNVVELCEEKNINDWQRGFASWNEWSTCQYCILHEIASKGVRAVVVLVHEGTVVVFWLSYISYSCGS